MNGTEITLPQMLDCRERRNMVQDMLIGKYHKTVVSYCMNIPGPIKTNTKIRSAFESGLRHLKEALKQQDITILEEFNIREVTGDEWIAAVDCDAEAVKDLAMQIEESHPLGRLFDMDVLGPDGRKLSRMRYRKCLICGRQAQECARSRTHTVTEMQDAIFVMLNDYFPEIPFPQ